MTNSSRGADCEKCGASKVPLVQFIYDADHSRELHDDRTTCNGQGVLQGPNTREPPNEIEGAPIVCSDCMRANRRMLYSGRQIATGLDVCPKCWAESHPASEADA